MAEALACWCGNVDLLPFCEGYLRCPACETLVSADMPGPEISHVADESRDFYGREYWFSYQERHLGHPTIVDRARLDLPERCLYWLRTLLRYKLPPARVLELGSGHGGFVAMLRWAGFDATGLEISPWVVEFAQTTFQVPMLLGPVEDQALEHGSLDVIALMDVLEHLRDPVGTMRRCLELLSPEGILLIQTPCYVEGSTYEEMVARSGPPLEILQPGEHLFLFSRRAIQDLFGRLGAHHIVFEPALFAQYDMFPVVSVAPAPKPTQKVECALGAAPHARLVQAMLDLGGQLDDVKQRLGEGLDDLKRRYEESERDRAMRLTVIDAQGRRLGELEAERNNLHAEVCALRKQLESIEADRAARLELIYEQGRQLGEQARLLGERIAQIEVERTNLQVEIQAQTEQIQVLMTHIRVLQRAVQGVQHSRAYKILRRLGRWKFLNEAVVAPPDDPRPSR